MGTSGITDEIVVHHTLGGIAWKLSKVLMAICSQFCTFSVGTSAAVNHGLCGSTCIH